MQNTIIEVMDRTDGEVGYAMRQEFDSAERYCWVSVSEHGAKGQYILRGNLEIVK